MQVLVVERCARISEHEVAMLNRCASWQGKHIFSQLDSQSPTS